MIEHDRPRKRMEVSLVPLINVVFLLLIFFLVSGTYQPPEVVKIEKPVSTTADIVHQPPLVVVLTADAMMYFNDVEVDIDSLHQKLTSMLKKRPDASILLKADTRLEAAFLTKLIAKIRGAGGVNIAIATTAE